MFFTVLPARSVPDGVQNQVFLIPDKSNDLGWNTQYDLIYIDDSGKAIPIGSVKIGEFGMVAGESRENRPNIPKTFDRLEKIFFSLGQDESYYKELIGLGHRVGARILSGLNDLALDNKLLSKAIREPVTKESLLRNVTLDSIKGRYRRLAYRDASLTSFKFSYKTDVISPALTFNVVPDSRPPTNVHVLIGRNGVGKTFYLTMMARALLTDKSPGHSKHFGVFSADEDNVDKGLFANLVSVAFSAFDPFEHLPVPKNRKGGIKYSYIGLGQTDKNRLFWRKELKNHGDLKEEFLAGIKLLQPSEKILRWKRALTILESDPVFLDYDVSSLAEEIDSKTGIEAGRDFFDGLSSGHKIVLLTITLLVADVFERTLVLMDEPESHLHPPLLSAFIRALSDLLIQQNGVAIIATHSPVVLQEVPKSCVWKLRRSGAILKAERPKLETFGENVGILTTDIFGLEVTESGFHKLLKNAISQSATYDEVIAHFGGQLGMEAKAIIRSIIANKERSK